MTLNWGLKTKLHTKFTKQDKMLVPSCYPASPSPQHLYDRPPHPVNTHKPEVYISYYLQRTHGDVTRKNNI